MPGDLQMLHLVIKSLTHDDIATFRDKNAMLVRLCMHLQFSETIDRFGAALSCISTILRTKPWLVSQYGVDTLVSSLTALSSPKAQHLPKEHAPFIYLRLCQTTRNIIQLHRKNLGGRMHLLIPLLQNLMTCLFTPHRYQGPRSAASLPWWLDNSPAKLDGTHATAYSRLLSTLCSPTPSSTSSFRRRVTGNADLTLTDETRVAREYAGQYVPYLLMHYCSLQLSGRLGEGIGEKLRPGVWDMMAVVGIEGMRGLNAGLGRDERAIWGVVYQEWVRVGRGR